jgi:hypothetical protein
VETVPPIIVTLAINSILGFGLYFYHKIRIGPLFWAIVAGTGVALGWLAHFSPFAEQTPQYIYRASEAPDGRRWHGLPRSCSCLSSGIYAEDLWARGLLALTFSRDARSPVDWKFLA